ncbi:unnamed protein product [Spirodela intermedia]|uniref:Cation efflux protein transmembrane domain-containing protein n=1 Tax=Spirodela intermedia TaxID=51605 RepID=A0A7I8LIA1_SPIIN|nr:unnamed protein product [Spirodela intermedia]
MNAERRRDVAGDGGPLRLSVPPRYGLRHYPAFPSPSLSSPFPFSPSVSSTPSKRRLASSSSSGSSVTSVFFLLFSLRSLYSLLPFLRASPPTFSLFPFSFLVSFFSFLLTALCFFLLPSPSEPPRARSLPSLGGLLLPLAAKSLLLALGFLLRFQALRTCGTAATILVEFSGAIAARSISHSSGDGDGRRSSQIVGFAALATAVLLLSRGWDRIGCFPMSSSSSSGDGECLRILPLLLPFLSGVLGFYESSACNWPPLRNLGRRRLRLVSLGLTTALLFFPALVGFIVSEGESGGGVAMGNLGWSLANTVIFGVVLAGNLAEIKLPPTVKDLRREFLSTLLCTSALELFYNPRLSLPGFLLSALLLWISVDQLASSSSSWSPLELENPDAAESFASMAARPLRHIWSERKSRKIAMFLLINSAYMVVEFTVGFLSNSLGLISDACHMLFDCAALGIGLYASYISRLPASAQFNYGRGRFEVVSGYVNAVFLVLVGALIVLESFERILDPQEISTSSLLSVSIGGLLVNVVGLVFFHEEHHHAHGGGACSHSHSESDHRHHHHHHHHGCTTGGRPSELDHPAAQQSDTGKVFFQEEHHHAHSGRACSHSHSESDHHHHGCTTGGRPSELDHHSTRQSKSRRDAGHHHRSHDDHSNDHHGCVTGGQPSELDHRATRHSKSSQDTDHHHHSHNDHCNDHPAEQWTGINFKDLSEHDHDHGGGQEHEHCGHSHGSEKRMEIYEGHDHGENTDHISSQAWNQSSSKLTRGKPAEEPQRRHVVDHNMEGIFLHVLADTMGSVGVVISTLLIKYKGWLVADPACSILISVMIVSSVVPLLRNSAEILLQRTPRTREWDIKEAIEDIARMKGICGVDRYHVWNFTTSDIVGTIHLRVSADCDMVLAREQVSQKLQQAGVKDLTIQLEYV